MMIFYHAPDSGLRQKWITRRLVGASSQKMYGIILLVRAAYSRYSG